MSLPKSTLQRQRLSKLFFEKRDRRVKFTTINNLVLQQLHWSPHVYVIDDFLNSMELEFLQEQIQKGGFRRSYVDQIEKQQGNQQSASSLFDKEHRTSTFMSFQKRQNSKIAAIERRASDLLGVWNTEAIEPLQLVRYNKGEFFGTHHDLGDLHEESGRVALPPRNLFSNRRLATIFCYLNDVPKGAGGETFFPAANQLAVQPKKGRAVLFSNVKTSENGKSLLPDERTIHEGRPVIQGTKYGLNIWICEN